MPFSSGTFSLYTPGNPVVTGTTIASTWANNTLQDIATGLSTCLLKDGSQTVTANLPMAGFKLTGLGAGNATGNSLRYEQLFTASGVTLIGPLLFTDASFDIGASGATRPRNIFLSGNATAGGTIGAGTTIGVGAATPSASGAGVSFPATQSASTDVNTLDDYEEGSWTPSLGGTTTYTTQTGTYTKIGRLVSIQCALTVNSIGSGSTSVVGGLPFTSNATLTQGVAVTNFANLATSVVFASGSIAANGTAVAIVSTTIAAGGLAANAVFQNSTSIQFSGSYITA